MNKTTYTFCHPAGRIIELRREAQRVIEQHGADSALTAELEWNIGLLEMRQRT